MILQNKNSGYTILVTLMIIGFLIVVTTGVLNLVLREMNDNRGESKYLQAYAGAEGAMELALLKIKQNGYGVYDKIELGDINNNDKILREDISDNKEILISYDLNSITKEYEGSLEPFDQTVIPLFYTDLDGNENKVTNINLTYFNSNKIGWNIVSQDGDGIGGDGEISSSTSGKGRDNFGGFISKIINGSGNFLDSFDKNYLVIVNLDDTNDLDFNLKSINEDEYFTKPISKIISSANIGGYKQNLETTLDNTAFLSILKYSIYSK